MDKKVNIFEKSLKKHLESSFSEIEFKKISDADLVLFTNKYENGDNKIQTFKEIITNHALTNNQKIKLQTKGMLYTIEYYKSGISSKNQIASNVEYIKNILIFLNVDQPGYEVIENLAACFREIFNQK